MSEGPGVEVLTVLAEAGGISGIIALVLALLIRMVKILINLKIN
jgi:hypothetical protein